MHGQKFNEAHRSDSIPDPSNTDNIFKVMDLKVKVTWTIDGSLSKTTKFAFFIHELLGKKHVDVNPLCIRSMFCTLLLFFGRKFLIDWKSSIG